ncbi:glycine cleavage system aminomethyltransferase GcvT [Leucobacter weissii]|uniref:Aminomethyltransferase n=1 Tax=Leucobacter weissii TaxID=1983706 RepID=A0A939MH30_9MICO|nr:glycine cleavage system aminomethyltransferase GcvT [Leucobacter weissii]MBO1900783.1 glycine cleavage system aminomethyltransferase GcvT [Leucobacter weissii]
MTDPRPTALHQEHERLGASFTDFGGWDMPLRYGSELAEHRAVRETAGLFDLSHMGELWIEGPDAGAFLNTALVGDLARIGVGKAKYSLIVDERGGIIDDLIGYRLAEHRYLVVPNAGNTAAVAAAFAERGAGFDVAVRDATAATSLIAVQGPASAAILHELIGGGSGLANRHALVDELAYYAIAETSLADVQLLLARTGYTGEDGFELYVPNACAREVWSALLAAGEPHGLVAAGLAARDSLRLEAGMPLYGNELSTEVTPFDAGLGPVVSFEKEETFVGRAALEAAKAAGPALALVGLSGAGRRAPRAGYPIFAGDREIGRVTSGQPSPTLGVPIALALVDPAFTAPGTALEVDLRGRREPFEVVALPFYRRSR